MTFKELKRKKRKKDFGEYFNSKYNYEERFCCIDTRIQKIKNEFCIVCAYCGNDINLENKKNYKKIKDVYLCTWCCCNKCKNYKEDMKLFFKNNKYLCKKCISSSNNKNFVFNYFHIFNFFYFLFKYYFIINQVNCTKIIIFVSIKKNFIVINSMHNILFL